MDYILFAGNNYYPNGGAEDIIGTFSSMEEAKEGYIEASMRSPYEWMHIYCISEGRIVYKVES